MSLTMYRNGSVYSAADPLATAMLVDGDVVAWVGSEHAATSLPAPRMEEVDLPGALVAPGFVDSHVHVTETGLALDSLTSPGPAPSPDSWTRRGLPPQAPPRTASCSATAGTARLGRIRPPTAEELDRAAGGREVYLARVDVHSALVVFLAPWRALRARCPGRLAGARPGQRRRPPAGPARGA